ncbi:MAG: phosphate acetyltransferase [Bryobacteraceae bacterium]
MSLPQSAVEFMSRLTVEARKNPRRIVFPEGDDPRIVEAAARLARDQILKPIVVGRAPSPPPEGVAFVDPADPGRVRKYGQVYYERRRSRGITRMEAEAIARRPLYLAALMVEAGDADGTVGGAANTTAETVRAALQSIGTRPGAKVVSSVYIMALHDRSFGHNGLITFADCVVVVEPTSVQLAEIAIASARTTRDLVGVEPVVALLSFSTKGSGRHKSVDVVVEALRIARERDPGLHIDGELQADAAISLDVGRSKAPGSTVAGMANTLIFPNLVSGNIGYKLMERLCGAAAVGPILQGLAKPANDLSRGASVDDIYNTAVITAVQACC